MKRTIPLFILDTTRRHKKGECDYVVCTDKDNGFIAKVDCVQTDKAEVGEDYRIGCCNNGISVRVAIQRMTGANPEASRIRTLLKAAMLYYVDCTQVEIDTAEPTRAECAQFLGILIRGNLHNVDAAGSNFIERQTTLRSLKMLQAIKAYLQD